MGRVYYEKWELQKSKENANGCKVNHVKMFLVKYIANQTQKSSELLDKMEQICKLNLNFKT